MHYKLHLLSNKINPFRLIHKLPFQKRRYQELGIDIDEEINKAFENKEFGLNMISIFICYFLFHHPSNLVNIVSISASVICPVGC